MRRRAGRRAGRWTTILTLLEARDWLLDSVPAVDIALPNCIVCSVTHLSLSDNESESCPKVGECESLNLVWRLGPALPERCSQGWALGGCLVTFRARVGAVSREGPCRLRSWSFLL